MRFYTTSHKHYCGIDLHAKTMYVCIMSHEGEVLLHQNFKTDPEIFLRAIEPFREDLVVAVECMFTWYWLADLCAQKGIHFVLGHALYKVLSLTILYEINTIDWFERVQDFASYSRLVKCEKNSAGKKYGTSGAKIGNVHLKWAFSEAAVLFLRGNPQGQKYLKRIEKKHGKRKALSILAHKLGRTVYYMLKRKQTFSMEAFLKV